MHLFDKENICFPPNPPAMRYWEIITKISVHKNISLKEAVKEFYELSGVPSTETMELLKILLNADEKDLIPFGSEIRICDNKDELLCYSISPMYAGEIGHITDIAIDDEHFEHFRNSNKPKNRVNYLIDTSEFLYSCELLHKIN